MKSDLPVTFEPPVLEQLPIELLPKKALKAKSPMKKAMADAQAFAKFGVQVLRVKARVLAALGKEAEQCGIKQIGHGKILLASDNAEAAITKLGGIVEELLGKQPGPDYSLILEIMRLQREFNAQLIATAQAHLLVDKQPGFGPAGNSITVAYPSGSPVMVGVGGGKPQTTIEQKPGVK